MCQLVLASPFAFAYPEWRETAEGLRESNRSFIAIGSKGYLPRKVLPMRAAKHGSAEVNQISQSARILDLKEWKEKMAKGRKGNGKKKREIIPEKDMFMHIMDIYISDTTTDEQRHRIYEAVIKVMSESDDTTPDDPKGA